MAYLGRPGATAPLTSADIPDGSITSAKIVDGTIVDGDVASNAAIAGSKVSITEFDDNQIQTNIALLAFKTASNGSLARYNLQDQFIDEYTDATGVDASASTNEVLASGAYHGESSTNTPPTGGDTSTYSTYNLHKFDNISATESLVVAASGNVDILVVAGGGSGGKEYGGGGGAGGLIFKTNHGLTANTYNAVIGDGGAGVSSGTTNGNVGSDSTWSISGGVTEFTAKGGGYGATSGNTAGVGGSSGGAGHSNNNSSQNQTSQSGDSGTYGFGSNGGVGVGGPNYNVGGGGGAGGGGEAGDNTDSGDGGLGRDYSGTFGTGVGDSGWFASGGGGGNSSDGTHGPGSASAGGGTAGAAGSGSSTSAQDGTGGGSGGSGQPGGNSGSGGSGVIIVRYPTSQAWNVTGTGGDLTLQSIDTEAEAQPTKADMVILIEDNEGTATINTDIKGFISRDSGTTFTEGTLVDEGNTGTTPDKRILAFHDLDISGQPADKTMCYKITTHNQSAGSKETKIHATSMGWR